MIDSDDLPEDEFALSPRWKHVAVTMFGTKYKHGDVVPHEVLRVALGLPTPTGKVDVDEYEDWRLKLVSQIESLKSYLLESKNMDLQAVVGRGYEIVKPECQTGLALRDGMKLVQSTLKRMDRRLSFIDRTALTAEQAKENADALCRASFLAGQAQKARRINFLGEKD
jgi:hypothetical protein